MRDDRPRKRSRKKGGDSGAANTPGFAGGQVGAELASGEAAATDAFAEGLDEFVDEARKRADYSFDLRKGFLFERIEASKYNRNAARAGERGLRASVRGDNHRSVDIDLKGGRGPSEPFQLKSSDSPKWLRDEAIKDQYKDVPIDVPKDKVEQTNAILEQEGSKKRVAGELSGRGVGSGGTSTKELKWATGNPKTYRILQEAKQVGREAVVTGATAAATTAVIGGAVSVISNGVRYMGGKTDGQTAIRNVVTDSAKSGLRGYSSGALGVVIRRAGGVKSNIASAIASGVVEVGVTVYEFAKGEITGEEAARRIGETGCAAASGIYGGAAAGAIFGPVGAVVGSVVGYMAMGWVYQSSLAILQQARLAEEEAQRVIALCAEATRAQDQQRKVFEDRLETWLQRREDAFKQCLEGVDDALLRDDANDAVEALARLVGMTGKALRFKNFDEFESFMTQSNDTLVL